MFYLLCIKISQKTAKLRIDALLASRFFKRDREIMNRSNTTYR